MTASTADSKGSRDLEPKFSLRRKGSHAEPRVRGVEHVYRFAPPEEGKTDAKESSLRRQQPGGRAESRSWLQCALHSAEASTLYPSGERIPHLG